MLSFINTMGDTMSVKWYGSADHKTNKVMFYLDDVRRCNAWQIDEFEQVVEKIIDLSNTRDEHGHTPVQLIASRFDHDSIFIAYRFTSDRAYDTYNSFLIAMGSSLGRGVFAPWNDKWVFDRFIR